MKSRIFLTIALVVSVLVTFSSCQKDQDEIFDEKASVRVDKYLTEVKKTLESAENGWALYYFPDEGYSSTVMTVSFVDGMAYVSSEAKPEAVDSSYYRVGSIDGASLVFDTYNSILHLDSTPSDTKYQANHGDFDFRIIECSPEQVVLEGKRYLRKCRMYPLKESAKTYLEKVKDNNDSFVIGTASTKIGNGDVVAYFSLESRTFSIGRLGASSNERESTQYIITENGIQLYEPLFYNGVTLYDMTFDADEDKVQAGDIIFDRVVPEGFLTYNQYLGKYTMTSDGTSFEVELKEKKKNSSYELVGLNPNYSVLVGYKAASGSIEFSYQIVCVYDGVSYAICPWDTNEGYYTWGAGIGIISEVDDPSSDEFTLKFVDNGVWESYRANSLLLRRINASDGKPSNDDADPAVLFANGSSRLPSPTMKKISE